MISSTLLIIIIVLILATLPVLIFRKKSKIETYGPLCMWKTKRTLGTIEKLAKKKKIWRAIADLGIVFSFGIISTIFLLYNKKGETKKIVLYYLIFAISSLAFIIYPSGMIDRTLTGIVTLIAGIGGFAFLALLQQSFTIISNLIIGEAATPGVAPVIPGMKVPGIPLYVPLYAIIGLVILLIVHEWGHGVVSRVEEIAVKSVGLLTLGLIPIGAFTEPDEKELEETTRRKRSRVYSVGSMTNFITAFTIGVIFLLPLNLLVHPGLQQQEINNIEYWEVKEIPETSSFHGKIDPGTKIYNIEEIYQTKGPHQEITLQTDQGEIEGITDEYGGLGITVRQEKRDILGASYWIQNYIIGIFTWIVLLNFLIGVINYLPFAIFDGARIIEDISGFYGEKTGLDPEKTGKSISLILTILVSIMLVINILPYFF
ncbi:MAG: site-2 protease family protein [archaeon]